MFVDSSTLVAIAANEPEAQILVRAIERARRACVSPIVLYETIAAAMWINRWGHREAADFTRSLVATLGLEMIGIGPDEGRLAIEAFGRFGKGRHKAALNMGDCFAYACAKSLGLPLLYKGEDFAETDIEPAV